MAYDYDLFVIGGGSGGVRCARISAGHGARVAIAEQRFWGGTCVNVGCVPKKLLVQAGEYGAWSDDSHGFGWNGTKGTNDWAALIGAVHHHVSRLNGIYRTLLENACVSVFEQRAVFVDPHTIELGDGRRVTAEKVVVATGGHPVRPNLPGAELGIVSDGAFTLKERPERVVIVGGGYIAVEFAGIFAALGSSVDLVFRQKLPLRGFDLGLTEQLAEMMKVQGISLHSGCSPSRVEADGAARRLVLVDGTVIDADLVFFATGRKPLVDGLGLERAGVAVTGDGAITVDRELHTSQPHIYAIGDVTDRLNLTPVATAEGHSLADTLFGSKPRSVSLENVPTAVFFSPPLATVGLTENEASERGLTDIYEARFTPLRHAVTGRLRRTFMKLVVDQGNQRVLGAHMLGDDAPEVMQGLAIAIAAGATKPDFDRTIGIHPTMAEEFVTMRTRTRVVGQTQANAAD